MGTRIKISAVVTCFNNEETIEKCIDSLLFADEIIVLDSFSKDNTLSILESKDCIIHQQKFKGYSQQKQDVINLASNDWVILLDSDEFLTEKGQNEILSLLQKQPISVAYKLPRREWVFWKWSNKFVKMSKFTRLFNRQEARVSEALVHESIVTKKSIGSLNNAVIHHVSDTFITVKVEKMNLYSQLIAKQRFSRGRKVGVLRVIIYPFWYFFRQFIIKRQFLNGMAGFIDASISSKYAFLKYAKLYEIQKRNSSK